MAHEKQQPNRIMQWADSQEPSFIAFQDLSQPASLSEKIERWSTEKLEYHTAPASINSVESSTSNDTSTNTTTSRVDQPEEKALDDQDNRSIIRCPVGKEFQQARASHPVLASTGCTRNFCQAGRAVHTDEPRIGENRAIGVVEEEAEGFLQELHREGFFAHDEAFTARLDGVLAEIRAGACESIVRETQQLGMIGGNWRQTSAELEFGIRRAWRNARKCIMRSHSDELKLCDLRNVTSSAAMASELARHMCEAFNGGNVLPTVFAFPPRSISSRGPMIWNHQFLEFAGYEMEDGSILGDPNSTALTKSILELGWEPPQPKSRWDLLPLVIMADDDAPAMIEVPPDLSKLVAIRHPRYEREFENLDLKWVAFPALTRLGFDIGGVQYTAAPFIGWFMDAEIGVRDLADTFRYNALPQVAQALGLLGDGVEDLDDLPEFERLSVLSRSQQELTYAVHWSYQQAKVSMSDTLTASMKWCRYDDEFKSRNGFRLPADPYWLAPPQGSIVPVWHRGGAPNYQPKPMICRHVQDPINAWQREKRESSIKSRQVYIIDAIQPQRPNPLVRSLSNYCVGSTLEKRHVQDAVKLQLTEVASPSQASSEQMHIDQGGHAKIFLAVSFCSAGTFAEKIALKLHDRLRVLAKSFPNLDLCCGVKSLDEAQASAIKPGSILLLVVSSTGQGEVPKNGSRFVAMCDKRSKEHLTTPNTSFRYAVYGNGDSRYAATYNGAAAILEQKLRLIGGLALAGGLHHGDTSIHGTTLQALSPWWAKLQSEIHDLATDSPRLKRASSENDYGKGPTAETKDRQTEAKARFGARSRQLLVDYHEASTVNISPTFRGSHEGTYLVTLNIGMGSYEDMSCIQVLPINSPAKTRRALRALGVSGSDKISLSFPHADDPSHSSFLSSYVDLEAPFQGLDWLRSMTTAINEEKLESLASLDVLEQLHESGILPVEAALTSSICFALPLLHPRTYSIASSASYSASLNSSIVPQHLKTAPRRQHHLDILVKPFSTGRFSHTALSSPLPNRLCYRILPSSAASLLTTAPSTPLVIIATGAGFAPVRCLLQRFIAASRSSSTKNQRSICLFLGLKPADVHLFSDTLNEAAASGVLERLSIVSSNDERVRIYDRLGEEGTRHKIKDMVVEKKGWVFVCTNLEAAKSTRMVLGEVLKEEGGVEAVEDRLIEEIF